MVSIHASSREDATVAPRLLSLAGEFQSTRPRGRTRLLEIYHGLTPEQFQSTRPRGRTRPSAQISEQFLLVSIHASSREDATGCKIIYEALAAVSIHASSREDATCNAQ